MIWADIYIELSNGLDDFNVAFRTDSVLGGYRQESNVLLHEQLGIWAYCLNADWNYSLLRNFVEWFIANSSKTTRQTVTKLCTSL